MVHTNSLAVAAAALLAALPVNAGLYSKSSPVVQVDAKNYDRLIAQSNYTSVFPLFAFYSPVPFYTNRQSANLSLTLTDPRILRALVWPLQEPSARLRKSRKVSVRPRKSSGCGL